MRIYLAGPMRDKELHNFPAFMEAAMKLRYMTHIVMNPAERDLSLGFDPSLPIDHPQNVKVFSLKDAFEWDFNAIVSSEAIVLLPGWRESKGTQAEVVLARAMERRIYEYAPDTEYLIDPLNVIDYNVTFDTQ